MNTYHDQLDAFEARVRAEQEETDLNISAMYSMCPKCNPNGGRHYDSRFTNCMKCGAELIPPSKTPLLDLLEKINSEIEKAFEILDEGKRARLAKDEAEGSDTRMSAQLNDAGFGSGGAM